MSKQFVEFHRMVVKDVKDMIRNGYSHKEVRSKYHWISEEGYERTKKILEDHQNNFRGDCFC